MVSFEPVSEAPGVLNNRNQSISVSISDGSSVDPSDCPPTPSPEPGTRWGIRVQLALQKEPTPRAGRPLSVLMSSSLSSLRN